VQDWLTKSGAGLYGNAPVFHGRRAAFYVLADYPGSDPHATWSPHVQRPNGPCGWQWEGTHTEFGCSVDRGWYDDWFAVGGGHGPSAPPFPYPATDFLALRTAGAHAHWGKDAAEQANVRCWQTQMAKRGWRISATGTFDAASDQVCRKFQAEKGLDQDGKVGPATWAAAWTAPVT
jgi:peptidoglycan hydrolase-like protein with peptidoglycan-binding domain